MRIGKFNYRKLEIGKVVKVDLFGRDPVTAQIAVLTYARRHGWVVTTRIKDGELFAMRQE